MTKKKGFIHVRLDEDLANYVGTFLKNRKGGISGFVNECIREDMEACKTIAKMPDPSVTTSYSVTRPNPLLLNNPSMTTIKRLITLTK